jgi:hypothetical protein
MQEHGPWHYAMDMQPQRVVNMPRHYECMCAEAFATNLQGGGRKGATSIVTSHRIGSVT